MSDLADALGRIALLERLVADLREDVASLRVAMRPVSTMVEYGSGGFSDDSPISRRRQARELLDKAGE